MKNVTYSPKRSLCYNIANQIGMPEDDMRKAVNAKSHIKEVINTPDDESGQLYTRDFLVSNNKVVMISLIAIKEIGYVDYMVAEAPMEYYKNTDDAIEHSSNWAASNAVYFTKNRYGNMAKIEALYEVSKLMEGVMHHPNGW